MNVAVIQQCLIQRGQTDNFSQHWRNLSLPPSFMILMIHYHAFFCFVKRSNQYKQLHVKVVEKVLLCYFGEPRAEDNKKKNQQQA